jgi:2'-5' RNA ligase
VKQSERIRSFIAVDIGAEVRAALGQLSRTLARGGADARWVKPEGMHATLKFLGGVEAERLEQVRAALGQAAAGHACLHLRVAGLGAFPTMRRPRVLWAGLHCQGLRELAAAIDAALVPLGFEPEKRDFNAHVTLARLRSLRGWESLAPVVQAHAGDEFGRIDIDAVVLYRSTLHRDGAIYTPLWTIPLAQHK